MKGAESVLKESSTFRDSLKETEKEWPVREEGTQKCVIVEPEKQ